MVRYAITDRRQFAGSEPERSSALVAQARRLAASGVDLLQLRERDLAARELAELGRRLVEEAGQVAGSHLRVLVNGPAHVAVAAGAAGVHLRRGASVEDIERARELFEMAGAGAAVVSVSCHSVEEVERARGADHVLFGPVFEKRVAGEVVLAGLGLARLRAACEAALGPRVLALGGVNAENAESCAEAGADGVAGIRMFL